MLISDFLASIQSDDSGCLSHGKNLVVRVIGELGISHDSPFTEDLISQISEKIRNNDRQSDNISSSCSHPDPVAEAMMFLSRARQSA